MTKFKPQRGKGDKELPARVRYLYKAASYLERAQLHRSARQDKASIEHAFSTASEDFQSANTTANPPVKDAIGNGLKIESTSVSRPERRLVADLRAVSLKSQARLLQAMKRSFCKRCNAMLLEDQHRSVRMENKSKNGLKPWADVEIIQCLACGAEKRFPAGATRQDGKEARIVVQKSLQANETVMDN